jgi:hypothetical protein
VTEWFEFFGNALLMFFVNETSIPTAFMVKAIGDKADKRPCRRRRRVRPWKMTYVLTLDRAPHHCKALFTACPFLQSHKKERKRKTSYRYSILSAQSSQNAAHSRLRKHSPPSRWCNNENSCSRGRTRSEAAKSSSHENNSGAGNIVRP